MTKCSRIFFLVVLFFCNGYCLAAEQKSAINEALDSNQGKGKLINLSRPIFSQIVVHRLPEGWKSGFEQVAKNTYIQEFVPQDQTVDSWTEMITVQGYKDFAKSTGLSIGDLLARKAAAIRNFCPANYVGQIIGKMQVDGNEAFAAIFGCAKAPIDAGGLKQGQGELALYLAIQGVNDTYVIQRAKRGAAFTVENVPITPQDKSALMMEIEPIKICDLNETQFQCWDRKQK